MDSSQRSKIAVMKEVKTCVLTLPIDRFKSNIMWMFNL